MTKNMTSAREKLADEFDCDLYRLIRRTEAMIDNCSSDYQKAQWNDVLKHLRLARPSVRTQMSAEDRERTNF